MIDWLINVAYNFGMFMLGLLIIFGALIHLKYKAEHTPEGANYAMLQELRKLNRLQQEQIEREEKAQMQAQREEIEQLLQTSKQREASAPPEPGFWDRMNMKLEAWNQRLDEQAAERKAKRLAKKSKTKPAAITPPPLPLPQQEVKEEEEDDLYRTFFDADHALFWQIGELEDMMQASVTGKLPKTEIKAALMALEKELPPNFWKELSALKAELVAINHHVLLADIEERELEYAQMKQLVEALLPSESVKVQYSQPLATPPPLPSVS